MAQLELDAERATDPAIWPDCCARCASPGVELVPVPAKYTKGVAGLAVPLCEMHKDDWRTVRFRNRIGAVVILLALAAGFWVVWELYPRFARPNEQDDVSRGVASFFLGFLLVLPLTALTIWWAKSPIRVLQMCGRKLTLAGVCRRFAAAAEIWSVPAPLPVLADAVRFEVIDYRPAPACPPARAALAIALAVLVGALFGWVVGTAATVIGDLGWPRNDWRYLGLAAAATVVCLVPLLGLRALFSRFTAVLYGLPLVVVIVALLFLRVLGLPFMHGFAAVLAGGPLLLMFVLVVYRVVWRWPIRSGAVAATIGTVGPLGFLVFVFLLGGFEPGLYQAPYLLGTVALLSFPFAAWGFARTPYCQQCDLWLVSRRVGALPRTAAEVRPVLASGQVIALAGVNPYDATATIGDVELKVHSCTECRERGTLVLELFDCRAGGKHGKTPTLVRIGRWLYPGPALHVIEKLYPAPVEDVEPSAAVQDPS